MTTYYFFPSGHPQIAALPLLLLFLFIIGQPFNIRTLWLKLKDFYQEFAPLCLFVLLVAIINSTHSLIHHNLHPLTYTAYFLYNVCVFYCFLEISKKYDKQYFSLLLSTLFFLAVCLFLSALIQLIWRDIFPFYRMTLSFNNPNQLGFFCTISSAILILLPKERKVSIYYSGCHLVSFSF